MIKLLQTIWAKVSSVVFPKDYFAWQTLIYLGVFSFTMSWVALLSGGVPFTVNLIATAGWIFFAFGIGWAIAETKLKLFGIPLALLSPWVVGIIICVYFAGLFSWVTWEFALTAWPLISFAIVAVPQFLNWEFKPKSLPKPEVRQALILLLLLAMLFSSWIQFCFRLQDWFADYPSLVADDFSDSGFVVRLARTADEQAKGVVLLTAAESEIKESLNNTPWPYAERWLLNLDEQVDKLESRTAVTLEQSKEQGMWGLQARPRTLENDSYGLDLMAIWSGPASTQNGYYLEKNCVIYPRSQTEPVLGENETPPEPNTVAAIECDLATPKKAGKPTSTI